MHMRKVNPLVKNGFKNLEMQCHNEVAILLYKEQEKCQ